MDVVPSFLGMAKYVSRNKAPDAKGRVGEADVNQLSLASNAAGTPDSWWDRRATTLTNADVNIPSDKHYRVPGGRTVANP